MPFDSGALAFTRFHVVGDAPTLADQPLLDKFSALALREEDLTSAEVEYGWCGGRHVLDGEFGPGHNVYNDCLHVGLRIDTNKVPSEIRKAYVALEEMAVASKNPSGFASRTQKKDAKETAGRKIEADLASGKFRRSKLIPVLWDLPHNTLYAPASLGQREQLMELFERTLGLTLEPITSGNLALRLLENRGKRREYEDMAPAKFAVGPAADAPAEYPWAAKGDHAKDWLGNEFLLWLWHEVVSGGDVRVGDAAYTVMFSKSLDLDCAFGVSGRCGLKHEGPGQMPEAMEAVRSGKVPRKTGLAIAMHGQLYALNLAAEAFGIGGLKLPEVEEADTPRVLFEERITLLRDFVKGFDAMFDGFLRVRASPQWEGVLSKIRRWAGGQTRQAA